MKDTGILVGLILLGGGYYLYSSQKEEQAAAPQITPTVPTPIPAITPKATVTPVVKPVAKVVAPAPAPAKATAQAPAPVQPPVQKVPVQPTSIAGKWVFVDSVGGERIFAGVADSKSLVDGWGKSPVMRLPNNVEAGVSTGAIKNNMIEVRVSINKKPITFWIDSTQSRLLDDTQRNYFVDAQKVGRKKTVPELDTIYEYFKYI